MALRVVTDLSDFRERGMAGIIFGLNSHHVVVCLKMKRKVIPTRSGGHSISDQSRPIDIRISTHFIYANYKVDNTILDANHTALIWHLT